MFRPPGTIYKGRRGIGRVVAIQRPPTKRTILVAEHEFDHPQRYFLSLPSMVYVVQYAGLGVYPFRVVSYFALRVFVANTPLTSLEDTVSWCPLPMHSYDGSICMGNTMQNQNSLSLRRLTDRAIAAYWSGVWTTKGMSRRVTWPVEEFQGDLNLRTWRYLSKTVPDLVDRVNWTEHDSVTLREAISDEHTLWMGRFYKPKDVQ